MTPEQKMQAVVEAAGGCWHKRSGWNCSCGSKLTGFFPGDLQKFIRDHSGPQPTDLNELFRLGQKLQIGILLSVDMTQDCLRADVFDGEENHVGASETSPAEALLNALYASVKGK